MKRELRVKVLFDDGSQRTYISEKAPKFSNLPVEVNEQLRIGTFGSKTSVPSSSNLVKVTAVTLENNHVEFLAMCYPHLCSSLPRHSIKAAHSQFESIKFSDKGEFEGEVDLIVGADVMWHLFTGKMVRSKASPGLVAMETVFGWVLDVPFKSDLNKFPTPVTLANVSIAANSDDLTDEVKKFWNLETIGIFENESSFFELYSESITRDEDNRYSVNLPFKENHPIVSDNYELSKQRLLKLHAKLSANPNILQKYNDILKEQMRLGNIEPADQLSNVGEVCYLPHRAVIREDKETTKLRIVFDASAKGNSPSLNDCLQKGPQLTPLLFDIIVRFRSQLVALSADIEKALNQISIEQDRNYLRFLWYDNVFSSLLVSLVMRLC